MVSCFSDLMFSLIESVVMVASCPIFSYISFSGGHQNDEPRIVSAGARFLYLDFLFSGSFPVRPLAEKYKAIDGGGGGTTTMVFL